MAAGENSGAFGIINNQGTAIWSQP
jgi:hypothetical protein